MRAQGERTKETEQRFGKATQSIEELHGEVGPGACEHTLEMCSTRKHTARVRPLHRTYACTRISTGMHACTHAHRHTHTALHCTKWCACLLSRSEWPGMQAMLWCTKLWMALWKLVRCPPPASHRMPSCQQRCLAAETWSGRGRVVTTSLQRISMQTLLGALAPPFIKKLQCHMCILAAKS